MAHGDIINRCRGIIRALAAKDRDDLLLTWGDGFGDSLLLTSIAHEWHSRTGKKAAVYTQFPELYQDNPTTVIYPYFGNYHFPFKSRILRRINFPVYADWNPETGSSVPPDKHIIAKMCESVGMDKEIQLRPHLYLSDREKAEAGPVGDNEILIQSSGLSARLSMKNKEWFPHRFQEVVDALGKNYKITQVGSPRDPLLKGAVDLRGKTNIRQLAAIMNKSRLFIGLVGFLMHLARASECPAVIVYGGREHPFQSGYICNENLAAYPPCSPCWLWNRCNYDKKCMSDIASHDVIEACHRQLSRKRGELEIESYIIKKKMIS